MTDVIRKAQQIVGAEPDVQGARLIELLVQKIQDIRAIDARIAESFMHDSGMDEGQIWLAQRIGGVIRSRGA